MSPLLLLLILILLFGGGGGYYAYGPYGGIGIGTVLIRSAQQYSVQNRADQIHTLTFRNRLR